MILDRRHKDDVREQAELLTKQNRFEDIRLDWQNMTDHKIRVNTVKRKVQLAMQANEFAVEERRDR